MNSTEAGMGRLAPEKSASCGQGAREAGYRLLFDRGPQPMWVCDQETHTMLAVNEAALRLYGYTDQEFRSLRVPDLFPAAQLPDFLRRCRGQCLESWEPTPAGGWRQCKKDGTTVEMELALSPVFFEGRDACLVVAHDLTERCRAEEALRESEERHRVIAELTSDYAYSCRVHANGWIEMDSATAGFTPVTGYSVAEVQERGGWEVLIHPEDLPRLQVEQADLVAGERNVTEARLVTKDGTIRWIRYSAQPIWDAREGRVVRLLGAVRDITERKEAEHQLQEYARQLQALSRRLLDVQEQERRALARELHDEIGQTLTGLEFTLEQSRGLPAEPATARLGEAQGLVRQLTAQVRNLSLRLRPTMLDDLGLLPALLWHLGNYTDRTHVQVHLAHCGLDGRLNAEVETAGYRIVQEALTNVARHAHTREAAVRAWLDRDLLFLQIEDSGVGFDEHAVRAGQASSGLSGMRERAALLGGRCHVESRPGAGTRVTAELPVQGRQMRNSDDVDTLAGG
jgi:PAS domain S-box-containing protein